MGKIGMHAVVVGAGMRGLLAARVLADAYDKVTVTDQDSLPPAGQNTQDRVTDARILRHAAGGGTPGSGARSAETLPADLVIDATGRTGRTATWIPELGYTQPAGEQVTVHIKYASRPLRLRPGALGGKSSPSSARGLDIRGGMGILALEDDQWILTLYGYHRHHPPTDPEGFLAFAKTVAPPDVFTAAAVRGLALMTESRSTRFPSVRPAIRTGPTLAELSDEERNERFDRLQERMRGVWEIMRRNKEGESVVVIPSVSLDRVGERGGSLQQAYEERFLILLLLLRQPRLRMIYVTSMPIAPKIVEYYLALLTGVIPSHARARLSLIPVGDASPRPLTEKLLERPRLLSLIRSLVPNPLRSHLMPYNTTPVERDLAVALGIPMYAADPRFFPLGTKSGCRKLFADLGVRHPLGFENLRSIEDVIDALIRLRAARPDVTEALVKLNEGVSGEGNALVDLHNLTSPGSPGEREETTRRAQEMAFELPGTPFSSYATKLAERGGIVEERITGVELRSPSVQLRVTPFGEVELLSTHDQVLGGPGGQSYLGCSFPADFEYAKKISADAQRIGERLAREGVLGRFAIDFVVVRSGDGSWTPYAIELNLRKGGTTHPFLTLQFLTDGRYDPATALFLTPSSREKHLFATDHLESRMLRGLTIDDLFDIVARHGLHFDPARQQGVVFHMISCLTELGRVGLTAVGDTPASAKAMYQKAERLLLEEARESLAERPLLA